MAGRRSVARWRDWTEWQDVHAGLFSSDSYDQQRAVSRVAAWRSRGDVPISVNATAQLVEIAFHEQMAEHQHHAIGVSARSHMELSLAYSSAIVRCVNGLVDCSQKGTYAMAVSALAQRIGIPLWIVDLRHESTHNQLPSLPVLRFAANHLLAWLRSNYWCKQELVLRSAVQQVATLLLPRLPKLAGITCQSADAGDDPVAPRVPLKDALDVEKLRDIVIPLLVDGIQYGEQIFPTGALFLVAFLPETESKDLLSKYPKTELIQLVLDLQAVWPTTSASLLSALSQKIIHFALLPKQDDDEMTTRCETELCLFWIKLFISNEWRERLKYVDEPIEEIYLSGASVLALCERATYGKTRNGALLESLRVALRGCKGIRNHAVVAQDAVMRKQLDGTASGEWLALTGWNACPLGQLSGFSGREFESPAEFPLELDQDTAAAYTIASPMLDAVEDEDAMMDRMMLTLDAAYENDVASVLGLEQTVHDHTVQISHQSNSTVSQKVLPQQEVQRIQSQIEIW